MILYALEINVGTKAKPIMLYAKLGPYGELSVFGTPKLEDAVKYRSRKIAERVIERNSNPDLEKAGWKIVEVEKIVSVSFVRK
jgi:hypothetical protein